MFLVFRSFLKVTRFEVTGYSSYAKEDIITASGIKKGDRLYSIDRGDVADRIKKECPYVIGAKVKRVFPNTLSIDVECRAPVWYVEIEGDFYSLDAELCVLEETVNEQKFINGRITKLTLPNITTAIVGKELTFGAEDAERDFAYGFMEKLERMSFKSRLSLVDIDNRFDIYIGVDGIISVYLGNAVDMEDKLRAVEQALYDKKLENCVAAEIYAADPEAIYIKPTYEYPAPETEQTTENESEIG